VRQQFQDHDCEALELEQNLDLGGGGAKMLACASKSLRVIGDLRMRFAGVGEWADGLMQYGTIYLDIDEARAAGERLAEERADG
jgi:hypothetical protein